MRFVCTHTQLCPAPDARTTGVSLQCIQNIAFAFDNGDSIGFILDRGQVPASQLATVPGVQLQPTVSSFYEVRHRTRGKAHFSRAPLLIRCSCQCIKNIASAYCSMAETVTHPRFTIQHRSVYRKPIFQQIAMQPGRLQSQCIPGPGCHPALAPAFA